MVRGGLCGSGDGERRWIGVKNKEYCRFAISFVGLGYIALWPLAGYGGRLFGVSLHPLSLPPALQAVGMLSAIFVTMRLLLLVVRRLRGQGSAPTAATPEEAVTPRAWRKFLRHLPPVKPRSQFGLRGTSR